VNEVQGRAVVAATLILLGVGLIEGRELFGQSDRPTPSEPVLRFGPGLSLQDTRDDIFRSGRGWTVQGTLELPMSRGVFLRADALAVWFSGSDAVIVFAPGGTGGDTDGKVGLVGVTGGVQAVGNPGLAGPYVTVGAGLYQFLAHPRGAGGPRLGLSAGLGVDIPVSGSDGFFLEGKVHHRVNRPGGPTWVGALIVGVRGWIS